MRHFRQTHASYQCAKRKQRRTSVDIAINCLVFITVVESVYSAVRTDSLYEENHVWSF